MIPNRGNKKIIALTAFLKENNNQVSSGFFSFRVYLTNLAFMEVRRLLEEEKKRELFESVANRTTNEQLEVSRSSEILPTRKNSSR